MKASNRKTFIRLLIVAAAGVALLLIFHRKPESPTGASSLSTGAQYKKPTHPTAVQTTPIFRPAPPLEESKSSNEGKDWARAVSTYTGAQADAYISRTHSRVSLTMIRPILEDWPHPLTEETSTRLEQLITDTLFLDRDTTEAARQFGLTKEDPRLKSIIAEEQNKIDSQIRELVGDEGLILAQSARRIPAFPGYSWEFIGETYLRGIPLSKDERGALSEIVAKVDHGESKRWAKSPIDPETGLTSYDKTFISEASKILTPDQINALLDVRKDINLYKAAEAYKRALRDAKVQTPAK